MNACLQRLPRLLLRDEPALVGVSAGVDSMVLLHLLASGWNVQVAHLNHRLRGQSSDADERLVRKSAQKLNLACHVEHADVKTLARKRKLSIEMAARECRHQFFANLARKLGVSKIALAHHADDQVELFLMRLLRGAGPEGLTGMPETGPSPVDPSLTIVRPLLGLTKEQIRAYARQHKICFREDVTNASISILRNRIRHKLIPLLKRDYQPGLTQTVLRLIDLLRAESEFVSREAEHRREPFEKQPVALQRRHLQKQLYTAGVDATYDLIEHLRLNPGVPITVAPGRFMTRDASGCVKLSKATDWSADSLSVNVSSPGSVSFSDVTIEWLIGKGKPAKRTEYFDAEKVGEAVILRHWRAGDRFQPIGMKSPVKLQDLFVNLKIPRDRRRRLVLATTAAGDIFWVEGLRIGEACKIEPFTTRRLQWSWRRHETC